MKIFPDIEAFRDYLYALTDKLGFKSELRDRQNIQALQDYRVALAFAIPILRLIKVADKRIQKSIDEVAAECEEVFADKTIFIMDGRQSSKLSEQLQEIIIKADRAVIHAGSICNNILPLQKLSEEILQIVLLARDLCDRATKRMEF